MLLNICCAPCGLPIMEHLLSQSKDFALYFYSPNIYPNEEYEKRLAETRKIASVYSVKIFEGEYDHDQWLEFIKGNLPQPPEEYPENSERCRLCFRFRLEKTAELAKKSFDSFATTLSVSRFKDVKFINDYGKRLGGKYVVLGLDPAEAHRKGLELSKKHNIYRQKYCGCEFSL